MNPDHYDPLPIHPWHWRNRIQKHYTSLLDSKSLVLLPHHQLCKPSMSEHIIIPDGRSKTLIRTSIVAEESSPTLNTILAKTDHYYQSLFISTRLAVVQAIHEPIMKPGVLAADFLQNPSLLIKENQFILPLPALFTVSPLTNKPLLIEIIATSSQRPEVYFREHCYKILFSQLHLLLKHGLALDVQTKDALLIIDNYKTRALVVRQFHLAKNEPKELHPEKSKELARVIIRTNLQNNINYWINILNQEYQLAPKLLWGIVREVISSLFATFSGEIDTTTLEFYRNCLLNQPWHYPSPVTTCLQGNRQRERYFQSASPLNP